MKKHTLKKIIFYVAIYMSMLFFLTTITDFVCGAPSAYTYRDANYETKTTEFNMGTIIYIELNTPDYNTNPTGKDGVTFQISSTENPIGVTGYAKETNNNTGVFRGSIILSYEHNSDGSLGQSARIKCNRDGDEVDIEIDANDDGIYEEIIEINVLYSAENNLQQDIWNFEWDSFLPMFIVGILIALIPKRWIDKVFSKIPILGNKFGDGYKYIESADKSTQEFNPFCFRKTYPKNTLWPG